MFNMILILCIDSCAARVHFLMLPLQRRALNGETRMERDLMDAKGRIDNSFCARLINDLAKKFTAVEGFLILTFLSFALCKLLNY